MDRSEHNWQHLSGWIAPAFIAIGAVICTAVNAIAGLEMMGLLVSICLAWILGMLVTYMFSDRRAIWAFVSTAVAAIAVIGVYECDRPILSPIIESASITQEKDGLAFDLEAMIQNSGHLNGNVGRWRLDLIIPGRSSWDSEQQYAKSSTEVDLSSQDFPVSKPVRGHLFFRFPGLAGDYARDYLGCGTQAFYNSRIALYVSDSKHGREWRDERTLSELGDDICLRKPPTASAISPSPGQTSALTAPEKKRVVVHPKDLSSAVAPSAAPPPSAPTNTVPFPPDLAHAALNAGGGRIGVYIRNSPGTTSDSDTCGYEVGTIVDGSANVQSRGSNSGTCPPATQPNVVIHSAHSSNAPRALEEMNSRGQIEAWERWRRNVTDHAGSRELVKADCKELRARLVDLWAMIPNPSQRDAELVVFDSNMAKIIEVSEDRDETLSLLSTMHRLEPASSKQQ